MSLKLASTIKQPDCHLKSLFCLLVFYCCSFSDFFFYCVKLVPTKNVQTSEVWHWSRLSKNMSHSSTVFFSFFLEFPKSVAPRKYSKRNGNGRRQNKGRYVQERETRRKPISFLIHVAIHTMRLPKLPLSNPNDFTLNIQTKQSFIDLVFVVSTLKC